MDHIAWSLVLVAAATVVWAVVYAWRALRQLRTDRERHGLRLRGWFRVPPAEVRDPWRCPECSLTAHGHWAKLGHQRWHDDQEGRTERTEPWDSASSAWVADRDAGTPALPDADAIEQDTETDAIGAQERLAVEQ